MYKMSIGNNVSNTIMSITVAILYDNSIIIDLVIIFLYAYYGIQSSINHFHC